MDDKIRVSIIGILEGNNLLSLSTVNSQGKPESCSAYYVYDENLNLYVWSEKSTRHVRNIKKNSAVAVNITDTRQKWGSMLKGLQIEGKATEVPITKIAFPGKLYLSRYPLARKLITNPKDFLRKYRSSMIKVETKWIKVLDEETFGKDVWKEIII